MLDAFLSVAYDHETRHAENVKLAKILKVLPMEDLQKLATGEAKLAFGACSPMGSGECWIDKFKGTPLFDQALQLEKAELEAEVARTQAQAAAPSWDEMNRTQDHIRVQKKMLDLELLEMENGQARGVPQPMSVESAQGAGAPGDAGPDAEPQKQAFAVTEEGHKFDAALYEMRARHGAEMQALKDHYTGGRFGLTDEAKKHIVDQGGHEPSGGLSRMGRILRFGIGVENDMNARHDAYASKKHRQGSNAWNPFGGMLTPTKHEVGGNQNNLGSYKTDAPELKKKKASANFEKAAISGGLIDKAVVNTIAAGKLSPERVAKAKALGEKVLAKGSKMVGSFDGAGRIVKGNPKGLPLVRQGAHMSDLMGKLSSGFAQAALQLAKKNPKLVGAGIGAVGGAIAGGPDHRLSGALGGAALGHAAGGIGGQMAAGKSLADAAGGYGKGLVDKAKGMLPAKQDPMQYAVSKKPPLPASAPVQAHAANVLDRLDAAHGAALPASVMKPGRNNVMQMPKAAAFRFLGALQALEA